MVGGFANITIAATRLVNNVIFVNTDAFKIAVEQAMDSSKELLRMGAIMQEHLKDKDRY